MRSIQVSQETLTHPARLYAQELAAMRPKLADIIRNLAALFVNDPDALRYIFDGRSQAASALGHPARNIPGTRPAVPFAVFECQSQANPRPDTDPDPYRRTVAVSICHKSQASLFTFYRGPWEFSARSHARRVTRGTSRVHPPCGDVR